MEPQFHLFMQQGVEMQIEVQVHRFMWVGIEIQAAYTPLKWGVIAHLEIRSIKPAGARLPITTPATARTSINPAPSKANGGDMEEQVTAWLDKEAAKPEWRAHIEASRQGELF